MRSECGMMKTDGEVVEMEKWLKVVVKQRECCIYGAEVTEKPLLLRIDL